MKDPGVGIVFEVGTEAFVDEPAAKCRIQHRKCDFNPSEKIAIHPICAGEKHPVVAVVEEIENPAVFEKASDDGADANMFREAGDPGSQGARSTDDQIDLDAGLRGLIQRANNLRFQQRIHLGDDVCRLALPGAVGFTRDPLQQRRMQSERRLEQVLEATRLSQGRELLEYRPHIPPDRRVAGE